MADREFAFHWDGGKDDWNHLFVVRFDLDERVSGLFSARILLQSHGEDGDVDPYDLIGKLGTLRIATASTPAVRCVHGVVVRAEDRGPTRLGALVELTLMPPLARAMYRRRSRIFLEKTTREIVEAVLTGDPKMQSDDPKAEYPDHVLDSFAAPKENFTWRMKDPGRIEAAKARPYVVQYDESDFDFVSRLLEAEGISYHFEHTKDAVVLVMTDFDDGRARLDPFDPAAPNLAGRHLDRVRVGGRMRPTRVKLVEYNWQKPKLDMSAEAKGEGDDLFVQTYPGSYVDSPDLGAPLAKARLERLETESRFATASGSIRLLGAGSVFKLDHEVARFAGEYLVVQARAAGVSTGELTADADAHAPLPDGGSFHVEVELARRGSGDSVEESHYRPAMTTPWPRIFGTQTATVTDEPSTRGTEIHVGGPEGNENGCVRLRFHWDTETERQDKEPTSAWVRVSQVFAGAGGGAVFHPRVGTEVIVAFEEGDPDRPIVVGRVYNGIQPASALGKGAATVSTLKSLASPGGKVFNELQFNDTAGEEKVNLTAGKDWNSEVGNDRSEHVTNNSTSTVDVDRSEDTGANRSTHVGGNNEESVDGDEKMTIGGNQQLSVGASQKESIGASQTISVAADRALSVGAAHSVAVGAAETYAVSATQSVSVGASKTESVGAAYDLSVGAAMTTNAGAAHTINTPVATVNAPVIAHNGTNWTVSAGATAAISTTELSAIAGGGALIQGATVTITSGGDLLISGGSIKIKGGDISLEAGSIKIAGGSVDITGSVVKVN